MKHLANIISLLRIVLLLALFFTFHNTVLFLVLYLLCGFTDVLDGYVARKTKTESAFGARLDSFADFFLFVVITVSVIVWMGKEIFVFLPWIILIAIIRFANIGIAAYKYRSFSTIHTLGNKATGLLLFLTPLFVLAKQTAFLWVVCVVGIFSAVEEMVIHLTSKRLDLNRRSIFKSNKSQL